jgi:hypothetical protein
MILPFSTKLNGKPTYFVDKIWCSLIQSKKATIEEWNIIYGFLYKIKHPTGSDINTSLRPKHHTIREDKKERWKPGTKIDFFINCRQKNMFCFTPVLHVVSVQKVEIKWFGKNLVKVYIDGIIFGWVKIEEEIQATGDILQLAHNDGFDTIEDFFAYFNENFTGKLIHWTDLKY